MATPTYPTNFDFPNPALKALKPTDSNVGSATKDQQSSASSVLSTLWPVAAYAALFFILFLFFRRWFPRMYHPRTFVASLRAKERSPSLPSGLLDWIPAFFRVSDTVVLNTQTLDGYLFLRLLKIGIITCLVGCAITWTILIPINASGPGGQTQLNILTFSNAADPSQPNSYWRFYAHALVAWIYFGFIIYMITRESLYYINLRQAYLVSPLYADRVSSRTVLFTAVPDYYLKKENLIEILGADTVRNIWVPTNTKELEDKVEERDKTMMKLENAETKLIKAANAARLKAEKEGNVEEQISRRDSFHGTGRGSVAARWIKPGQRPTHRLKFLIGTKVDTIDRCREDLKKLIPETAKLQQEFREGKGKTLNSVFVEFNTLRDAQSAYQSLTHHQPLHMSPRYTGIYPEEIIWSNLRIKWWEKVIRVIVTYAIVVATVIFWSIPVAFIGTISQLNYLVGLNGLQWLSFLLDLPKELRGIVTGLLPVVLLSVLMSLLPVFLRLLATIGGEPTLSSVEYTVQNTYFWFYIVQGFLITTLSSGAAAAAAQIVRQPEQIITLLAQSLPHASNFYLSYIILQGLGVVSQVLLSLTGLAVLVALGKLLDNTPRKMYKRWSNLSNPGLGTTYPIYTTMFIIAICYSCIAPLVQGFAVLGLFLFYLAYKYQFLYVYNVPCDTKGLMYPRALQQLFTGLYLAELCLIGLFAINLGKNAKALLGPLVLMIVLLVFTILYHLELNTALSPLLKYLPKTLESEERRLLAMEGEADDADGDGAYDKEVNLAEGDPSSPSSPGSKRKSSVPNQKDKGKVNFFMRWLRPDKYADYYVLRRLVPRDFVKVDYQPEIAGEAYFHPSITEEAPLLWIPRDDGGVSQQEINETPREIGITDEGARLDAKNKIIWNQEDSEKVPIYEEKIYY